MTKGELLDDMNVKRKQYLHQRQFVRRMSDSFPLLSFDTFTNVYHNLAQCAILHAEACIAYFDPEENE